MDKTGEMLIMFIFCSDIVFLLQSLFLKNPVFGQNRLFELVKKVKKGSAGSTKAAQSGVVWLHFRPRWACAARTITISNFGLRPRQRCFLRFILTAQPQSLSTQRTACLLCDWPCTCLRLACPDCHLCDFFCFPTFFRWWQRAQKKGSGDGRAAGRPPPPTSRRWSGARPNRPRKRARPVAREFWSSKKLKKAQKSSKFRAQKSSKKLKKAQKSSKKLKKAQIFEPRLFRPSAPAPTRAPPPLPRPSLVPIPPFGPFPPPYLIPTHTFWPLDPLSAVAATEKKEFS